MLGKQNVTIFDKPKACGLFNISESTSLCSVGHGWKSTSHYLDMNISFVKKSQDIYFMEQRVPKLLLRPIKKEL